MANTTYGRTVVISATNKSGGGLIAGDVCVVDTTNNLAFTTDTSGGFVGTVGIAQGTIANNAVGLFAISGYVALVNTNASVTRGHYGKTYTVAKQATDAGASRGVGTFCEFTTGGTTPDAIMWPVDLLGSSLTNPMSAVGDIIQGTTAGAPAALAAPLTGKVLQGAGVTTSVAWKYPPGYEIDYAAVTSTVSPTATTEATANTLVAGNAVTYDGSTIVMVEFFCPNASPDPSSAGANTLIWLYDGASSIGALGGIAAGAATKPQGVPVYTSRRLTPSNASHTYTVKASVSAGTGSYQAGAGGIGVYPPMFIRITKVSGGA